MKRAFPILLAALAALTAGAAFFVEVPADGSAAEVQPGGKAAWISGVATNGYAPALLVVREAWTTEASVEDLAWTNHTYSVAYTNAVVSGTNTYVTVSTNTAARPFETFPATMTAYWTNDIVRAWSVTNWVPALAYATTNSVVAGTTWIAPGDRVLLSEPAPSGGRVTIAVED